MIENHIKQVVTFSGYYPRPGIVLDDTEYKPAGHRRPHPPPIITAAPPTRVQGDIFDVTVSAIQGPGGEGNGTKTGQAFVYPVELEGGNSDVITTAQNGQHFVSIDGKRTYMNLFGGSGPAATQDVAVKPTPAGSYGLSPLQTQAPSAVAPSSPGATSPGGSGARPPAWRKPAHPPVRIDTCIVGDDTTCDVAQHERCRTEVGVSSCHCRPGYSRRKHREPCHRIVSIGMSLRMDSAMSMTPFSDIFMAARIHNIYPAKNNGLTLNMTLQLAENADTLRPPITGELSKHVQGVIHRRQNNVGNSALWVDNSPGVVSLVQDINECSSPELNDCSPAARCTNVFGSFQYINECSSPELNDCSPAARCTNVFGSFQCTCPEGTRDPWVGNLHQSGRTCESCDPSNCNHRGTCSYQTGQPVCKCSGSFYGAQCEIDGEVLGVAIGASVCALLIILVTLIRRWNREQKIGSPVFGYMPQGGSTVKTPAIGGPPYQVSLEDRLRWAQIADAMAHANHYAPVVGTMNSTRPSSAMFGYSLPHHPVPLPRLRPPASQLRTPESSTSEEEDRTDLLGRNFQVPRPKSRSSVANQSGIYYDVDYEQQNDVFSQKSHPSCIPLNTYTMGSRLARPSKLTRLARPSKLTRLARPSKLTRLARPSKLTRLARSQS
ncbi:hypothetical protein M8J75_011495 [Diaphorina citri]|nr:hypothetical protein M8J75_011495 [Diaphorina citri]